jgi:hypothetical protein
VSESNSANQPQPPQDGDGKDGDKLPRRNRHENWLNLPSGFDPIDATIDEVASWRRCSRWTVHDRMRRGIYKFYKDGNYTKIVFQSVKAERAATIERSKNPTGKKPVGRPRKKSAPSITMEVETT